MNGHWFCNECGEAVCLPSPAGRWDARRGVTCPLCHKPAADWINDAPQPVTLEQGLKLFRQMKDQL
jgi:hypothetical protein